MPIWGMDTTMIATLDKQINELMECKPLTESEVEALVYRVSHPFPRRSCPVGSLRNASSSFLSSAFLRSAWLRVRRCR